MIVSDNIIRTRLKESYKEGLFIIGDSIDAAGKSDRSSHIEKASIMSGQRWRYRGSFSVGGKTAREVRNEQFNFILEQRPLPASLGIFCGSNNINNMSDLLDSWDAYVEMVNLADAYGIQPWLYMIPARGAQQQNRARWELWNAKIADLKFRRSFPLYNAHAGLVDPNTGINIAGTCADLDHPEEWGRGLIAQYVVNDPAMASAHIDGPVRLAYSDTDSTNFLSNACFTTGGGTLSGGATGAVVNGATGTGAAFILVPGTGNVKGNWQVLTRVAGSTAPTKLEIGTNRDVTPGHIMEFNGRIRQTGAANAPTIFNSGIQFYWADAGYGKVKDEFIVGKAGLALEEGIFHVRTQVPAGAVHLIVVIGDSNGNAPTVDSTVAVAQLHLADITAIENAA